MAGELWVRVDAFLNENTKILMLISERGGPEALNTFVFGLGYCRRQNNAGYIPRQALPLLHGDKRHAALLERYGFWEPVERHGWQVHDWADYQPSWGTPELRSASAKNAAMKRWHPEAFTDAN